MPEALRPLLVLAVGALLAACQAHAPQRTEPRPAALAIPRPAARVVEAATETIPFLPADHPPVPALAAPADAGAGGADVWTQLRDTFAMPGCDYTPGVRRWAGRYAASPPRFAAQLDAMLPALDYAQRQLRRAALPGEFALLPIVESHYRPIPGPPGRPAGIWQMVGGTARQAGLRIDAWFDGRLNLAASTAAAVRLFDRYAELFAEDWRLVASAWNAGEYRIRRLVDRHARPGPDAADLQAMGLPGASLEYLDRLLALACLVREPERYGLDLPALPPGRRLGELELDGTVGESLARALTGLSADEFQRFNGGLLRGRNPPGDRLVLLLPEARLDPARQALAAIPPARRLHWRQRLPKAGESLRDIAHEHGMAVDALLSLNGLGDAEPPPDQPLWLPAVGGPEDALAAEGTSAAHEHIVRSGESLWVIARRHGLTVAELLRYNRLPDTRIRPGQKLRLSPP